VSWAASSYSCAVFCRRKMCAVSVYVSVVDAVCQREVAGAGGTALPSLRQLLAPPKETARAVYSSVLPVPHEGQRSCMRESPAHALVRLLSSLM